MTMQPLDPPADQGPPPLFDRFIRRGALIILIFFGGFLGWAAVAPLDEGVVTSGQVAVDSRRKTVQHLEGASSAGCMCARATWLRPARCSFRSIPHKRGHAATRRAHGS